MSLIFDLFQIATNSNRRNIIELLLRHGSDPNASSPEGESVLYLAASRNNEQESNNEIYLDILRLLLSYGARMLDHAPEVWFKPFEAVLENGNIDAVRLFISNGLKLEKCNVPFPLHCAARNKYSQVLEFLLIQKYFDIDRKDSDGLTPLHEALYHKNLDNVKTLLAYKAGVDFPNDFGDTPLCTAVQNKDLDCVKILLAFGAHPKVEFLYRKGRTPLCLAVRQNDTECVDILLANGAELGLSGSTFLLGIKNQINSKIMLSFLRHVALLESQLHFVDQGFYTLFASKCQVQSNRYLADCRLELERLQTSIVYGSTTFYEFLTKKLTCSSTRLTDDYVSSVLESNILENMFLIYGEHLKARFSEVRDFLNLRKEASRALDRILPFDVQTFHIVVKRILNRLNAKDLICLTLI
ncbi:hypothetical protein QAD02_023489 [Eretmocerus hayati]|uniref:Uncharacterized protein n=1 Tax=Eretmocerus hayati TaxID=131215 RepID=A0ACC2PW98_9HYME|nr:hypothetical protein QAD02_023489 [Eretmocerus hayati]